MTPYLVRVKITNLNIRKGPGTNYGATGYIQPGIYTIVAESTGKGAAKWGKLKSGAGWISLLRHQNLTMRKGPSGSSWKGLFCVFLLCY